MRKSFDKKFIEFPLVCFVYCSGDKDKLRDLLDFYIVNEALKMEFDETECKRTDFSFVKSSDFDMNNPIHAKIVLTAKRYDLVIPNIEAVSNKWIEIKTFILDYEEKYGKDAYCRMGKSLTCDVINGVFPFREYVILAAIQSTLGKRKIYLRITYEQIANRMLGYKSKKVANELGKNDNRLSDRQIKNSVIKLMQKKLITSVTYLFREKYYSTRIKSAERLREMIAKKKLKNAELRFGAEDYAWSKKTQQEITCIGKLKRHHKWRADMSAETST